MTALCDHYGDEIHLTLEPKDQKVNEVYSIDAYFDDHEKIFKCEMNRNYFTSEDSDMEWETIFKKEFINVIDLIKTIDKWLEEYYKEN